MKKIAVILSGSGRFDGSEIHESTLTLLALSKNEVEYLCFAHNKEQYHVINHLTTEEMNDTRNVLIESARIARGNIKDLKELNAKDFDALVLPGGYGAAKNLSSFAYEGENFTVDADVEKAIKDFYNLKKPIAALCIAPVIIAKVLGAQVTIGNDKSTAQVIEHVGGKHINKDYHEVAIDTNNKIVTTPCYMIADNIYKVWIGIEEAIEALIGLTK